MPTEFQTAIVRKGVDLRVDLEYPPTFVSIRDFVTGNCVEWVKGMPVSSCMFTDAETGETHKEITLGVHVRDKSIILGQLEGINSEAQDQHPLVVRSVSEPDKKENILSAF